VSADGRTLWVIALPDLAYAIDMHTGLLEGAPINVGLGSAQFSISPNGALLGIADLDGDVAIVNTQTRTLTATVNLGALSYPSFATFSPDDRYLWVGTYSGLVAVIDLQTDRIVHTLDTGGWVTGVTLSGDGRTAYVSTTPAGSIIPPLGIAYLVPVLASEWRAGGLVRVFNARTFAQTATIVTGNVPMAISIP
jgi:DNA-binding beta-propeller fold protein YncE